MGPADCHRCGSAGSVEFEMCQVCYWGHLPDEASRNGRGRYLMPRQIAWEAEPYPQDREARISPRPGQEARILTM